MPPTSRALGVDDAGLRAQPVAGEQRDADRDRGDEVVSKPTAVPEMMLVAGPVLDASAISRTGRNEPAV